MTITVTQLADVARTTAGTSTSSSFSYGASKFILAAGYGRRGTGIPSWGFSWSGSPALNGPLLGISVTATGTAQSAIWGAITTSSGSATLSASLTTGQNAKAVIFEIDGLDLTSGDIFTVRQQSGTTGTFSPTPDAANLRVGLAGALTGGPSAPSFTWTGATDYYGHYDGTGGSYAIIFNYSGDTGNFTSSGGSSPFNGHLELLGAGEEEPLGWPEAYLGMQALDA